MADRIDVVAPKDELAGAEAVLVRRLRNVGDHVAEHEPLLELDTQKSIVEVAAPAAGVLVAWLHDEGDTIRPGERLAVLELGASTAEKGEAAPVDTIEEGTVPCAVPAVERLSPGIRRLLAEHDLDVASVPRRSPATALTREEIIEYVAEKRSSGAGTCAPRVHHPSHRLRGRRIPHTPMRRHIAQNMAESLLNRAPHVTSIFEADVTGVCSHRRRHRASFEARGVKLTLTAYFVHAAARAMQVVPQVNSTFHDDALEVFDEINIGVATSLDEQGLVVPVIGSAQDLDLFGIASRLQELTDRARQRTLRATDLDHGTFTISNHGVSGSLLAAPIILHQTQSAALGVGKVEKRLLIVEEGGESAAVIRDACFVTLTIDHRALDAFQANGFLRAFTSALRDVDTSHELTSGAALIG